MPRITVIPTLHVASMKFYDQVLFYLDESVKRYGDHVRVLLEGICDAEEDEQIQQQEYRAIMASPELQQMMHNKAEEDTLFSSDVQREMCAELALDYNVLQEYKKTVRLQECYFKPKMAATCGLNLHNDSDIDMKEVQALLKKELEEEAAKGEISVPNSIPVSQIGTFPRVRAAREKKVARVAQNYCRRWVGEEKEGEIIIPWGYFHTENIVKYICAKKSSEDDLIEEGLPELLFVPEPGWSRVIPFGVPEALLETSSSVISGKNDARKSD